MPNWKLLKRVVAFFGRLPRALRRREKSLGWNQAAGIAEEWLDKQADAYDDPCCLAAKLERYSGWHEQQTSDNASVYSATSMTLGQRSRQVMSHYTAHGQNFMHPSGGCARAAPCAPLPVCVAKWIVPSTSQTDWACRAVAELVPGAACVFPPDGPRLPLRSDWATWQEVQRLFVPFDGTVHDAARLVPGYVNLRSNVSSPLTGVPERANLTMWHEETHRLDLRTAVHDHGALQWCSSPCLPRRAVHMLHMEGGAVVTFKGGLRAHSQRIYRNRWEDDSNSLRRSQIHSGVPLPFNSLSKADALHISLYMSEKVLHRLAHPGWYNQNERGDEGRPFYGGDLGSENVIGSNLEDTVKRIWQATLQPTDPDYANNYKPFCSETEASQHVTVVGRLLAYDHLPCAMHNDFTILKSIGLPYECVASLNEMRQLLNMPTLQWEKEGTQFRQKKMCMIVLRQARYSVAVERLHTQPVSTGTSAPWVDAVHLQDGAGLYGAYTGGGPAVEEGAGQDAARREGFPGFDEDHYMQRFGEMLEDGNRDGELCLLQQLTYDLMTSFRVDQLARSYGLSEVKQLQRKYWPAWLAQAGQKGHFHVIHHHVRQLLAPFARSERRSMVAFMNSVLSLSGEFGHDVDNDEVQELLVLVVKKFLADVRPTSSSEAVHRAVRRVAASLHMPMSVIPQLIALWGVAQGRQGEARRRNGSTTERVRRVARMLRRTELVPDPGRVAGAGELGELGRMLRGAKLEVRTTALSLEVHVFHYPHLAGTPPVLTRAPTLKESLDKPIWDNRRHGAGADEGSDSAADDAALSDGGSVSGGEATETAKAIQSATIPTGPEGLQPGQQWVGTEYSRYAQGQELDAMVDRESGRFRGYLRNRWHRAHRPSFPSVALRDQVSVQLLSTLSLLPCPAGPWLLCTWGGASTGRDASTAWIRLVLPESCLLVQLGGKDAGRATEPKQALVDALLGDTCYLSKAVTLLQVAKEAHRFAPLLRSGGRAAQRFSSGARKLPHAKRGGRRPGPDSASRRPNWVRYVAASPPPTVEGQPENLTMCMYSESSPRAVDASIKRGGKEAKTGREVLKAWRVASGVVTDTFDLADAVQGTVARQVEAVSGAPPTATKGASRTPLQAAAFPKKWDSVLPKRLSSTALDGPCGGVNGDNLKVRPVASALTKLRHVQKFVKATCDVIQSVRLQGEAYSYTWLTADRARPTHGAASGHGEGEGGDGGGGAGVVGGGGQPRVSSELSRLSAEVERLVVELAEATTRANNEASYVFAALAQKDVDAHQSHASHWADLASKQEGLRKVLLRADRKRALLLTLANAPLRAAHGGGSDGRPAPPAGGEAGEARDNNGGGAEGEFEGEEDDEDDEPYERPSSSDEGEPLEWDSADDETASDDEHGAPDEEDGFSGSE